MAPRWSEKEWDELFRAHPPVAGHRPDRAACAALGRRFNRTPDGILWMWGDAERHRRGAPSNTASQRLIDYLDRRR
jgi:hypothetical protein